MATQLPDLPYDMSALEPHISARTLEFHYGKHHKAYVDKFNELVKDTIYDPMELEAVIKEVAGKEDQVAIFNNAAQVWNHTFYWHCMTPNGGGEPTGTLLNKINESFGDFETFKKDFKQAAISQFGSGWAWLVAEDGKIKIIKTGNAELPMTRELKALLTVDVWEHAYYLDYQNRRPDYLDTFLSQLVNWEFVAANLG